MTQSNSTEPSFDEPYHASSSDISESRSLDRRKAPDTRYNATIHRVGGTAFGVRVPNRVSTAGGQSDLHVRSDVNSSLSNGGGPNYVTYEVSSLNEALVTPADRETESVRNEPIIASSGYVPIDKDTETSGETRPRFIGLMNGDRLC